jgi:ferric-dicitrate binding protein FerR (iron transport regulator)
MNKDRYTEKEWEELTSRFKDINVDKAWDKLHSRLDNEGLITSTPVRVINPMRIFYRAAAVIVLLVGIGAGFLYITRQGLLNDKIVVASGNDQRNVEVTLPDGSKVWLNRNSRLTYTPDHGKETRNVSLSGEAFFDIAPDASKPFVIDAGKASVKVIGTSFNVITSNTLDNVEVYVRTGKVMLSDPSGSGSIVLEPGFVGTIGSEGAVSMVNENRNYMAWKTDTLVFEGAKLDVVFSDLRKVFNINISTDDPEISQNSLTSTFFSCPEDTIIQVICNTFNLRYQKDGSVYHLTK